MSNNNRAISVVIVGGSYAGATAAKQLAGLAKGNYPNLKVTLIDKSTHYFHAVGFPKALINEDYASECFLPFSSLFDPKSNHEFVHSKLSAIKDAHHVQVEGGREIYFDYLILATGSQSPGPINPVATNKADGLEEIARLRDGILESNTVMVVGGGAVGVEIAGFLAEAYPAKKVTLVHSGSRLLPMNFRESIGTGAVTKLKQLGVAVILNERIEIPEDPEYAAQVKGQVLRGSSGTEYQTDVLIKAIGLRINSDFLAPLELAATTKLRAAGPVPFIRVLPTLQLAEPLFPNIFVAGDANDLPMSAKYAFKAEMQGGTAAGNVKRMVEAGFDQEFAHATAVSAKAAADVIVPSLSKWSDMVDAIIVPIGSQMGVIQVTKITFGCSGIANFIVRQLKSKDFMLWMRKPLFKYRAAQD
ncbi:hypothetical protein BX661DRAFT_176449 [Kickxella alabastrina]|uniref:uncharacterized protein n=1 Tax=Kickxella alabastrina TaxID=61397 RepID=UPI0022206AF9|nr:uncharacterized protein BX661DRAFT_176449 [Kickxella alabastrina]KAI7833998.1 hypothetical protein BX661DRAFT_176449 [Kickxella alabastrina]